MKRTFRVLSGLLSLLLVASCATSPQAASRTTVQETARPKVVSGQVAKGSGGMVASAQELASRAGAEIMAAGGNAVDAAVATAFAITVVEPNASSLGGEGMMVLSLADGRDVAIDFRSWSPGFVTAETERAATGPKSACIPGLVAGLTLALEEYGTMPLRQVMAPAIRLAREGFPLHEELLKQLSDVYAVLGSDPVAGPLYYPGGLVPEKGALIVNKDMARALELIAEKGAGVLYRGEIGKAIVDSSEGWFTSADLQRYQAVTRDVVISDYRGYKVIGTPPIVAGIVVAEALNILENWDLSSYKGWSDPEAVHLMTEALLLAEADRMPFIGDPDYYKVPIQGLMSEEYAKVRAKLIDLNKAIMPTANAPAGDPAPYDGKAAVGAMDAEGHWSTTQISVLDKDRNAVSITQTLSSFWGSRKMVPGYGFFMNNEMQNFNKYNPKNPKDVNVLGPYKRPRTVLAPTIVRDKKGEVFLVLGTPGAGRIPSTVVGTIVNIIDFGMTMEEAIKAPKFCSRTGYKEIQMEGGYPAPVIEALKAKGHEVKADYGTLDEFFGGINAIVVEGGQMIGVGSFRRDGGAAGF